MRVGRRGNSSAGGPHRNDSGDPTPIGATTTMPTPLLLPHNSLHHQDDQIALAFDEEMHECAVMTKKMKKWKKYFHDWCNKRFTRKCWSISFQAYDSLSWENILANNVSMKQHRGEIWRDNFRERLLFFLYFESYFFQIFLCPKKASNNYISLKVKKRG